MRAATWTAGAGLLITATLAHAQTGKIDLYHADAMQAVPPPGAHAVPQGVLERYPNHLTMFIVRQADGQAEVHEHIADVFFVTDGSARLLTGGKVREGKPTGPGEIRGAGLAGASEVTLHKGDVVHIPANLPHQLQIAPGTSFAYFVVKVPDAPAPRSRKVAAGSFTPSRVG